MPYRLLGRRRACGIHDRRVANWLRTRAADFDIVHAWPLASLRTIQIAKHLGIPIVLERINAHTRFAYEVVSDECNRIGVKLPAGHDHQFNSENLEHEEAEYDSCDFLLCPSGFVRQTFLAYGFPESKLLRHQYGFDENRFNIGKHQGNHERGIVMLYAGACEPRKGLHYALEAWLSSGAQERGTFMVCGTFIPGYAERLGSLLSHPSVQMLGQRGDLPDLMRKSDIFVLPSIEEGSALVTYEARGCGCVLVVSDASGAVCEHLKDALVHPVRDVKALTGHITLLDRNRELLATLRRHSLMSVKDITWTAAGVRLHELYREAIGRYRQKGRAV